MNINRGYRGKLQDQIDISVPFIIEMETQGSSVYDTCCFGVDENDKISDDRYTVFYNQPSSPEGALTYTKAQNADRYQLDLNRLPASVSKLVFTVSIDGAGTMKNISSSVFRIISNGNTAMEMILHGTDFSDELAVITAEIYRKNEWRISAVARGFNGGLDALVKNYGGEVKEETAAAVSAPSPAPIPAPAPVPTPVPVPAPVHVQSNPEEELKNKLMNKISLSKDKINLEKHVISLSKCVVNLEKKSGVSLSNLTARVVVALDYSGSMSSLYNNGTVQRTLNRLVPLGLNFDDNGSIDLFLFQNDFRQFPDVNLANYDTYVTNIIKKSDYSMGGTNYAPVIEAVIYGKSYTTGFIHRKTTYVDPVVNSLVPTFMLFITDGENADKGDSDLIIKRASSENIFIQFIGIGNTSFNYLRKLDDLPGRVRDNTGFSQMSELDTVGDDVLYNIILEQFSNWLRNMQ